MLPFPALAAAAEDEQAINYEPSIAFVDVEAGGGSSTTITVRNQTRSDARFAVQVQDLRAEPGPGRILEPVPIGTAPRGAGAWLDPSTEAFTLRAGTERRLDVAISVPEGAGAGGHYGAVVFTARPLDDRGSQVRIDSVVGVPVLLTVAGAYERDLRVSIEPDRRLRWTGGRQRWTVHLRNEGDVHEVVSGRVAVDAVLSGRGSTQMPAGILLPGESRTERVSFDLRSAPDAWTATARVDREGGATVRAAAPRLWVVPWWLPVALVALAAVVRWRRRARRVE
jgi:hypothetical protein